MKAKKISALKHILLALAFAFAVTAFIPAVNTVEAQAKTIKISTGSKWQKAPVIKKTGTYAVTQKKTDSGSYSYVAFTAPKAGTYKITISNLKSLTSKNDFLGNWYICKPSSFVSNHLSPIKVKTEGGSSTCLWTASQNYDGTYLKTGKKVNQYMKTRSATIKLNKGEKVYSKYWGTDGKKYSYTITIKKTK